MVEFDNNYINIIDSNYKVIDVLCEQRTSKICLVEDIEDKKYICKIYDKQKLFVKELKNYENYINKSDSDYLIKFIDSNGINPNNVFNYIIFEYAENMSLIKYVEEKLGGFEEIYCKLIFEQILKGIQELHNIGLCHRNLTLGKILLGKNFEIKIANFSHADFKINNCKIDINVDMKHQSPEALKGEPFNGIKNDIFNLGIILLELVTGKSIYGIYKDYFEKKEKDSFWKSCELNNNTNLSLSDDFKKLVEKMISFKPKFRLTIQQILESDWFAEINVDEEEREELDNKLINELKKRKAKIIEMNNIPIKETKYVYNNDIYEENRDFTDEVFSSEEYKIEYTKSTFSLNDIIKINLSTDPYKLMNQVYEKLKSEDIFEDKYDIQISEKKNKSLKFTIIKVEDETDKELTEKLSKLFLEETEEKKEEDEIKEEEKNNEEDNYEINDNVMDVEIFNYKDEYYLLRFVRKTRNIEEYKEVLKLIQSYI